MHKTKQQRAILILALVGIMNLLGNRKPTKQKVLAYIRNRKLYRIPPWENEEVSSGDKAWETRFAYLRFELSEEKLIHYKERDCWQITDLGIQKFLSWAERVEKFTSENEKWKEVAGDPFSDFYLTEEAIDLAIQMKHEIERDYE